MHENDDAHFNSSSDDDTSHHHVCAKRIEKLMLYIIAYGYKWINLPWIWHYVTTSRSFCEFIYLLMPQVTSTSKYSEGMVTSSMQWCITTTAQIDEAFWVFLFYKILL